MARPKTITPAEHIMNAATQLGSVSSIAENFIEKLPDGETKEFFQRKVRDAKDAAKPLCRISAFLNGVTDFSDFE